MSNETAGEARLMEPVYRMIKIVQQKDADDAKIVASLACSIWVITTEIRWRGKMYNPTCGGVNILTKTVLL